MKPPRLRLVSSDEKSNGNGKHVPEQPDPPKEIEEEEEEEGEGEEESGDVTLAEDFDEMDDILSTAHEQLETVERLLKEGKIDEAYNWLFDATENVVAASTLTTHIRNRVDEDIPAY